MNNFQIIIKKTISKKSVEALTFLLILISIILIGMFYSELADKIPIYFNWLSKDANGLAVKNLLWAIPLICSIIGIGIYKLQQYPKTLNYQNEKTTEYVKYSYRQTKQMMRILNLLIGFLCLSLTLMSILDGLGIENNLNHYLKPLAITLFIGMPIFYIIKILRKTKTKEVLKR